MKNLQILKLLVNNQHGWIPLAIAAASLAGSAYQADQQHDANRDNKKQAKKQMKFQERMSSSAHQREVQDLRAAGLNPILSAGGSGSSTPMGASSITKPADIGDPGAKISSARQSETQVSQGKAQTKAIQASEKNTNQNTITQQSQDAKNKADALASAANTIKTNQEAANASILGEKLQQELRRTKTDADFYDRNKDWLPHANAITPLVGQGIGAATNALSLGSIVKGIFSGPTVNTETRETYNSQGEHMGTTTTRKGRSR
ncbi:MAG: DNA pilot protein [Wigfec virus K19_137]|nr:MAG: DNA pilot protein [Wigfec virus K19_137]